MESYTNIEYSKKLAEILPLESADMLFQLGEDKYADSIRVPLTKEHWEQMMPDIKPCWSLAALLSVLHDYTLQTNPDGGVFVVCNSKMTLASDIYDNPVDACFYLIVKLHELKML